MSTKVAKQHEVNRSWYVIDLNEQVLGRAATEIARILRGKHKPIYTPSVDTGDFVVVVNAEKVKLTGRKLGVKTYYHHTGYVGGIRGITAEKLLEKRPDDLLRIAVRGMLPKNKLGRQMLRKLKIYSGGDHPHTAQQPKALSL